MASVRCAYVCRTELTKADLNQALFSDPTVECPDEEELIMPTSVDYFHPLAVHFDRQGDAAPEPDYGSYDLYPYADYDEGLEQPQRLDEQAYETMLTRLTSSLQGNAKDRLHESLGLLRPSA